MLFFVYSNKNIFQFYVSYRESNSLELSSDSICLTTPDRSGTSLESIDNLYDFSSSEEIYEEKIELNKGEPRYLSFQEILDLIATPPSIVTSEESQMEKQLDDQRQILVSKLTY